MAKVDLKHVAKVRAKGRVYIYAWRGGPRIMADPSDPAAFAEEYLAHHASRKTGDRNRLSGLITAYKASDAWRVDIGDKTRASWGPWLDKIHAHFGEMPIGAFDRPLIRKAIKQWRDDYRATPRAADIALAALSRLLSFGVEDGLLAMNACIGIGRLYSNDRSDVIWTEDDLTALEAVAAPELIRVARLAVLTGLRKGDLLRLSWSHVKPFSIEIATGKSGGRKITLIPLYGDLRDYLATIPKKSTRVLVNTEGKPWGSGFNSSWNRAKNNANAGQGIDKHFHDLRGSAATSLFRADFSIREIAEMMTWSEDQVDRLINRYVKRDEILMDKIRRLDEGQRRADASKPGAS